MMTLTFRRSSVGSGRGDESWIGRSSAAGDRAWTRGGRFIVAFAEFFNGHLQRQAVGLRNALKRLHHRQNDNHNHKYRRSLVQDPIESSGTAIGLFGEIAHATRKIAMQPG